jgi:hypothetical protein
MRRLGIILCFGSLLTSTAWAGGKQGDFVQTDTLGMNVVSHNFDTGTTTTVSDAQVLSLFIGLHYYVVDNIRVGMNFQFSDQLGPSLPDGESSFRTFALLPQVGWSFYDPFFAALVVTIAPRTAGGANFDAGLQGVFGVSLPLAERVRATIALEVPWNFVIHQTLGLTPLLGVSIRL